MRISYHLRKIVVLAYGINSMMISKDIERMHAQYIWIDEVVERLNMEERATSHLSFDRELVPFLFILGLLQMTSPFFVMGQ